MTLHVQVLRAAMDHICDLAYCPHLHCLPHQTQSELFGSVGDNLACSLCSCMSFHRGTSTRAYTVTKWMLKRSIILCVVESKYDG